MIDSEKLNQYQFLVKKALITLDGEKQQLFNQEQNYLQQRNKLERELVEIYEIFFEGETYIYQALTIDQYTKLIKKLKSIGEVT